jgi:hypothetical protein
VKLQHKVCLFSVKVAGQKTFGDIFTSAPTRKYPLTGGYIEDMAITKSTEFVWLNGTTPGPLKLH